MKKNPWILNTIKQYFATMKSMNIGKSSTQFFETAAELDNVFHSLFGFPARPNKEKKTVIYD